MEVDNYSPLTQSVQEEVIKKIQEKKKEQE